MLLVILMAIPLIGALMVLFMKDKSKKVPFIFSLMVFLFGIFSLKDVFRGMELTYEITMPGPFALALQADTLSTVFLILASFLWLVVSIYSPKYMEHEGKVWVFDFFTLSTLFAVQGIFLAANLLTMLLFFELMTISSYFWVIHRWNKQAFKAGYFYLFFSIVGGLLLALGIVTMGAAVDILPDIGSGMVTPLNPELFSWSIAIFLVAFGIKAGMVPLHLWMSHTYSITPTPGNALSSGILIKVGAYGLIRVAEFAGLGVNLGAGVDWLGPTVIIIGTCTMLLGVLAALIQSDANRLLAYHSISQMGYIILGLGIALYVGSNGGYGLSGGIYHIINHSLFKVALFLGVGIIYIHTGETNLYKLGGLWRRFPVTAILMLVAVLGITGAPGLNGYASKSLLHHGISLAAESGTAWLIWVERLFLIVGVGTASSFAKLYYLTFLGKPTKCKVNDNESPTFQVAMSLIIIVMLGIGIRPEFLLNNVIVPASQTLGMKDISATLMGLSFWNFKDIFDIIVTLSLGVFVCWAGLKTGAFHWHPPTWMTIEGVVQLIGRKALILWRNSVKLYRSIIGKTQSISDSVRNRFYLDARRFDQSKSSDVWGVKLIGISADIAILILMLGLLIVFYTFINPGI